MAGLQRVDTRIIIHIDYDAFYASVVENENPALKSLPLAIQQKQIVVTCNYEARRRGLRKLQLITEAKQVCPDVVIVLGEDISRFRDASKALYSFMKRKVWSERLERLGFDEIWLDCTDMVDYNMEMLNSNDLAHSFFCMNRDDPTSGFEFDASTIFGPTWPPNPRNANTPITDVITDDRRLHQRLVLGSHLARHLRHEAELHMGYTATVGIATNKLISKLVGNVNKPKNQTTMLPCSTEPGQEGDYGTQFMDEHDIGKVPGIGFKLAQKIRAKVLGRQADFDAGLVYGGTKEQVTVRDVRLFPGMGPEMLEDILSGPGSQKGIGGKIWALLHGVDDSEVNRAKRVPSQISQEDSYMKYLRTFEQVRSQLLLLSERLIRRMHIDLTDEDLDSADENARYWMAHPRTLRLTTRPRPAPNADGSRARTFNRISRSAPIPNFVFSFRENPATLAEKLTDEALVPMFRKLHTERQGWNLSLINVAVSNMAETATDAKEGAGRDIGRMFKHQDEVLKDFRILEQADVSEEDSSPQLHTPVDDVLSKAETSDAAAGRWQSDDEDDECDHCPVCQAPIPEFAAAAHALFHVLQDG